MAEVDWRAARAVAALRGAGVLREAWTAREVAALLLVATVPESMRDFGRIAEAAGISKPALTRAADSLVDRKLIWRATSLSDARRVLLRPTPAGVTLAHIILGLEPDAAEPAVPAVSAEAA